MTQKDVHFEVFRRPDPKGAWVLHDVSSLREKALSIASDLARAENGIGVKVVKETYDSDTGDFLSTKIFEDGHAKLKLDLDAEDALPVLPCFKPDDLYSSHARATMTRVLRGFLSNHKITVTELIHRSDLLEKLKSAGTIFQHAVQKVAVAQAQTSDASVQQIIKALNELSSKAVGRVYRDTRRNYFPTVKPGGFGALAEKLASESDGTYVLNGALAQRLKPLASWNEKLLLLVAIAQEAPGNGPGHTLLLGAVDMIAAEIAGSSIALHDLIGESENLGQAILLLADLFLGNLSSPEDHRTGLVALSEQFAADGFPTARISIANRIVAELKSGRRLCPTSRLDELAALRKIANSLVLGDARYLSHENLIAAFTLRSRRLVSNESIGEYLAAFSAPDDKVDRLLTIEDNIIGTDNKKQLGLVLRSILCTPEFADYFVTNSTPVMVRLRRLAELQARARRSNFRDDMRDEFVDCLDSVANDVESRGKVFKSLQENLSDPADRAMAILKLCTNNVLTEGRVRGKARDLLLYTLAQPGFLAGYLARAKSGTKSAAPDSELAMSELAELLELAGISREAGMKSIAA